jgi:hypothetical protein
LSAIGLSNIRGERCQATDSLTKVPGAPRTVSARPLLPRQGSRRPQGIPPAAAELAVIEEDRSIRGPMTKARAPDVPIFPYLHESATPTAPIRFTTCFGNLISSMAPLPTTLPGPWTRTQTVRLAARRIPRAAVQFAQGFKDLVDGNGRLKAGRCPRRGAAGDRPCIGCPGRQDGAFF